MIKSAKWITPVVTSEDVCYEFKKDFTATDGTNAVVEVTAIGVYDMYLNGERVGKNVLAPGWTSYKTRHQYQKYFVTLKEQNQIVITVGKGWYRSPLSGQSKEKCKDIPTAVIAAVGFDDTVIYTDENWFCTESNIRFSEIYDGEKVDYTAETSEVFPVNVINRPLDNLILQEGEDITEHERIKPKKIIKTLRGETVIDFGQEITGYVEIKTNTDYGDEILISHAEVLDSDGNFYTENYRTAKAKLHYICDGGKKILKPRMTFFGFRYIRLDKYPMPLEICDFTAVVVHSDFEKTGSLASGHAMLNKLISNAFWGQKCNFLDIPTDCPQRNERLGWTGDAQVFCKTASYNYNVLKFFKKWLKDMSADQLENGAISHIVPNTAFGSGSAAWDDAAVIIPWQMYETYGDVEVLENQFDCMKKYIDFITTSTKNEFLWTGGTHFGDWLGLDAPVGSYKGSSREDFIASAFYVYSVGLFVKSGKVLNKDMTLYERLHDNIKKAFMQTFSGCQTQTEYALTIVFDLAVNGKETADKLAEKVIADGKKLQTGFVGTPYILHALSKYGHSKLAYDLLLREEFPSWLYPITKGATTIWEHWDGIMEDSSFWDAEMNSFNHYAYGAVLDWIYEVAGGIKTTKAGFEEITVNPHPDKRLGWLSVSINTRQGEVKSSWEVVGNEVRYEIMTPTKTTIIIDDSITKVCAGNYVFFGKVRDN